MDFSKNFRSAWWGILVISLGCYFSGRYDEIQAGEPTWFDALIFIVWVSLAIGPFFKEIEIFGFKFKQEIEELKSHVTSELASIRTTIQSSSDNRQTMSPSFLFGYPPPDSQLGNLEMQIKAAIQSAFDGVGSTKPQVVSAVLDAAPPDTDLLFRARLGIEKELRRIQDAVTISYAVPGPVPHRRPEPVYKIVDSLLRAELITPDIAHAVREVYSVCSPAIHGEEVTPVQVDFVRNTAPEVISALKSISGRYA